jgi:hypothetical protein
MTLPCAQCGRELSRKDVVAVRVVVTIEHDLTIRPPYNVYEIFCAACRLDAGYEAARTFDDLLGDVAVWQVRKGRS